LGNSEKSLTVDVLVDPCLEQTCLATLAVGISFDGVVSRARCWKQQCRGDIAGVYRLRKVVVHFTYTSSHGFGRRGTPCLVLLVSYYVLLMSTLSCDEEGKEDDVWCSVRVQRCSMCVRFSSAVS
jgi:hypothetical protein